MVRRQTLLGLTLVAVIVAGSAFVGWTQAGVDPQSLLGEWTGKWVYAQATGGAPGWRNNGPLRPHRQARGGRASSSDARRARSDVGHPSEAVREPPDVWERTVPDGTDGRRRPDARPAPGQRIDSVADRADQEKVKAPPAKIVGGQRLAVSIQALAIRLTGGGARRTADPAFTIRAPRKR
jgi:hypothetical protein